MEVQTIRGFIIKIEIGRAGLVTVQMMHDDRSIGTYVLEDLDADPERFNERLSKLAILRDAMNRAEPVEIEHAGGEAGRTIERVTRITRDHLLPISGSITILTGFVLEVMVLAANRTGADQEMDDLAQVFLLDDSMTPHALLLPLQIPERLVADHQLTMIRSAQEQGVLVRLMVELGTSGGTIDSSHGIANQGTGRIVAVSIDYDGSNFGRQGVAEINGFVESLSLIRLGAPGTSSSLGDFAVVGLTTAPPFSGPGGSTALVPFTPELIHLLVARSSPAYYLFEAGLRDNLRMRVRYVAPRDDDQGSDDRSDAEREKAEREKAAAAAAAEAAGANQAAMKRIREHAMVAALARPAQASALPTVDGLVLGAELLAHLASASRPVWIAISRETLDHGPEVVDCTDGVPTSDLRPMTLRDLRLPYPAVWSGYGCFNPGVYRFQFQLPTPFKLFVDEEEICLYDAVDGDARFGHACLGGDHDVRVEIVDWTCDYEFVMDVYQLR